MVVILDGAMSAVDPENTYYKMAQQYNVLIKSIEPNTDYNGALVQKVWPDHAVFVDWFHPDAKIVWF